ncbi:hypothetical protein [Paraburkholderia aromaticivorans]|uniref:hypothetical protein n=1 Tax=Paraburkholderia aromaticivorans TaxID=2026199 RepID=UPI0014560FAA|nr:hypothetical protein [Paraburkholderia aromaticivorans]
MIAALPMTANARRILEMRERGEHPRDFVAVSFVGKIEDEPTGFVVYGKPESSYDWRWCVGLHVIVFARGGPDILRQLKHIRNAGPKELWLWDVDDKRGAYVRFEALPNPVTPENVTRLRLRLERGEVDIELTTMHVWNERELIKLGF